MKILSLTITLLSSILLTSCAVYDSSYGHSRSYSGYRNTPSPFFNSGGYDRLRYSEIRRSAHYHDDHHRHGHDHNYHRNSHDHHDHRDHRVASKPSSKPKSSSSSNSGRSSSSSSSKKSSSSSSSSKKKSSGGGGDSKSRPSNNHRLDVKLRR